MLVISEKEKKWSNGEKYEKSYKNQKPIFNSKNQIIDNVIENKINILKKYEINNNKIQNRELISHSYQNPFLNKNYIDVLDDQTNFLIPKNSNNLEN
jgi:hypothetical protein